MFQTDVQKNNRQTEKIRLLTLETSLQYLKGVGPKLAEIFAKRNIHNLNDLIHWCPRVYRDQRIIDDFTGLQPGSYVTMYGEVVRKKVFRPYVSKGRGGKRMYEMVISTAGGWITCKYFRLPYRGYFDNIAMDQKVKIVGRITFYKNRPEFHHPDIYPFNPTEKQEDIIVPVYTEIEKISQNKIRKIINTAFSFLKENPDFLNSDPLPQQLKEENKLIDKISALEQIHQPPHQFIDDYLKFRSPAQKRLIFDEFFFLQLYMGLKKTGLEKDKAYPMSSMYSLSQQLKKSLPFQLTNAQERVLKEIETDLQNTFPMHRLIQGDVGCGKTIVSLLTCCQVIENHFQCAIMAPTEILAEQHYQNAQKFLEPLGIKVTLLTGKTRTREKRNILEKLISGYTSLCIGTHALIQESVQFKKLGLVIIDEQHRFGVHQRSLLKKKGVHPHFLVMTATPIPRSLAMTLYGDLDVSVIDEMPLGRKPVLTRKTYHSKRDKVWAFVENQVQKGRQAYIVYPLVEESEHIDMKNAMEEYENLKTRFPNFTLGLIHGRLNFFEKQEEMSRFVNGQTQILVSTTVIEVGVDVPNASMMVVENAERFGLSQLHQLRGRVGRGEHKSYCVLILSGGFSKEALSRLSIMEQTSDGFKIAEADLKIRGPGEFLGTKQSGLPEFKVANLVRDGQILQMAKTAASQVIKKDPYLEKPEHRLLKKEMQNLSSQFLPG